jgi:hypothetical protein
METMARGGAHQRAAGGEVLRRREAGHHVPRRKWQPERRRRCPEDPRGYQEDDGGLDVAGGGRCSPESSNLCRRPETETMTVTSIYGLPGSIETTGRTRTTRRFSRWPQLGAGWPEMVARRGTSGGGARWVHRDEVKDRGKGCGGTREGWRRG